jgi:hypothetical protein
MAGLDRNALAVVVIIILGILALSCGSPPGA